MKRFRGHLLVQHPSPLLRDLLQRLGAAGEFEVVEVGGWQELGERVITSPASGMAIIDPCEPGEVEGLMTRFPSLTVVAAIEPGRGQLNQLRRLGNLGVVQIIDLEDDRTAAVIRERLDHAKARPLQRLLSTVLLPTTSGYGRSIVSVAAQVALEGGTGAEIAERMNITSRTLTRWCRRAGLPAPRQLLGWMRTLAAAELLDDPGRTVQEVAVACGYASHVSLRQALRTFVGQTPSDLRQRGAFAVASQQMLVAFDEARSTRKRYRTPKRPSDHDPDAPRLKRK